MTKITRTLERLNILSLIIVLACALQVLWWVFDTSPPFELVSYTATAAQPGGVTRIEAVVKRDLARDCSVPFSRHLFDATGVRFDISGHQMMSASALNTLNQISPDRLRLIVPVPPIAAPGRALITTVLEYRCNPLQESIGKPIRMEMKTYFEVLP